MARLLTVASCSLNQWVLDWDGNLARIKESIHIAKARNATLRTGPELEITGYGLLDHFLENDVYLHSVEMLAKLLQDKSCHGILIDVGVPLIHRNCRYNCRVICLDGKILLIRPKLWLANDGNYREMRYFTPWARPRHVEQFYLPRILRECQGDGSAKTVPFGDAVISTPDTCVGAETCEELFTPDSPHNHLSLNGVEIITNSSGSHHTLRKLDQRIQLIQEATRKNGGIYLYANQQGCDGDRLYYDGSPLIIINGDIVAQGTQFSLTDVEVVTATVDLEDVRAYRFAPSRGLQAIQAGAYDRIEVDFELTARNTDLFLRPSPIIQPSYHCPEEEIALSTACWLWDYLRRSGAVGFLVPLSGGIDSCATAVTVFSMCRVVIAAAASGNSQVLSDLRRIATYTSPTLPTTPQALCNQVLHTVYMGMSTQSSPETRSRASQLATAIGAHHTSLDIDPVFDAQVSLASTSLSHTPSFSNKGAENLALQNIQARSRMVTAYLFAQLLPTARARPATSGEPGKKGIGGILVLGSANVGEALRGYYTKYDCSSADLNPIGSIDKADLKRFVRWAQHAFELPCLHSFLTAVPTAELEPITEDYVQSDEVDMGLSYAQLSRMGKLRKVQKLGPYGMFQRLVREWGSPPSTSSRSHDDDGDSGHGPEDVTKTAEGEEREETETGKSPAEVAALVKRFFHFYAVNRHKMTTLTPALHANDYSPDDNRFDLRPFMYPGQWEGHSFRRIDEEVAAMERELERTAERASGSS